MPISLRLPENIETQIANFSERQGLTKSALIVRSIQEYLTKHAQPSSLEIYVDAMNETSEARSESVGQRPHKQQVRDAIRRKHTERSKLAKQAIAARKAV
jgi:predicted DNA-binding protein